jgi:AraC family transcriptional regulator, regulatory protein of adaptative response / methylated-DNA-[protein]-cysteine methyltransferase
MMEAHMLSPDRIPDLTPLTDAAADYDVVRRAIAHIRENWRHQPAIDTIAEAAGVTPTELHHLFRRWAGLSPKAFLQALTLDRARTLLRDSASVLDAT